MKVSADFEVARLKYKPDIIKFLLVAEAPPKIGTGRFFYFEHVHEQDSLFLETMKVLYGREYKALGTKGVRLQKNEFLKKFQTDGFYLLDVSDEPMKSTQTSQKKSQLKAALPLLIKKAKRLVSVDTRVILISATVYDVCCRPLQQAGLDVVNVEKISFPGSGQQRRFREQFGKLLR